MLAFPSIDDIRKEHGHVEVTDALYAKAKQDYDQKLVTEQALLNQFRQRQGLTEEEAKKLFCEFLVREAVYVALHEG